MVRERRVEPRWDIGEANWATHQPNPRFAVYHPAFSGEGAGDAVLDTETRLVWERAPVAEKKAWDAAIVYAYTKVTAGRKGWRLPTIEELLSLVDPRRTNPTLPSGHPFVDVKVDYFYWSSNLGMSNLPTCAWGYDFGNGNTGNVLKSQGCYVWLVRGGYGHDYPY